MKKIDKKAFTLIELLVVIAVIGILVLLAVPRLLGYAQRAELARIQHDVRVIEQEIGTMLINKDDDFNKWRNNIKDLNQLVQDEELFEKKGPVVGPIDGTYKVIPEEYKGKINTKLQGTFYANSDGKVYYEHGKMPGYSDEEIEDLIKKGYIPVATAEELNSISNNGKRTYGEGTKWEKEYEGGLGKKYVQVTNIDLSEYDNWTPIGTGSARFKGTYDGGNYVITGLKIKSEDKDYQGLFGRTEGATISNVGLIDNKVTGKDWVGGLAGEASSSTINNSYSTGLVTGGSTGWFIGGLVGKANNRTEISNSYSTGLITGKYYVGGLVGMASFSTKISNSYTTSEVTGNKQVGGLVGEAYSGSTISNSYATGLVTGASNVGGLVGRVDDSTVTNSYWDTETTLQEESAGGKGKSTKDMKLKGTYADWDFVNVWEIDEGNDYPKLR